jgi:hypothetical protein
MNCPQTTVPVPDPLLPVVQLLTTLFHKVEALPDARKLEAMVHQDLKQIECQSMEACVQFKAQEAIAKDVRETRCPHCEDGWAVLLEQAAPRYAVTVRGRVDYVRPVYRCDRPDCRRERSLFDEELGLDPKEHYTPLMQDKLA